jgi:hypothetical protein
MQRVGGSGAAGWRVGAGAAAAERAAVTTEAALTSAAAEAGRETRV